MKQLTYTVSDKHITFTYSATVIHSGSTDEQHICQVLIWLRRNLDLGLAEAMDIWRAMVTNQGLPPYTGRSRAEIEAEEIARKAYFKEYVETHRMTKEQISQLIGEDDMCQCGHTGAYHRDNRTCVMCACNNFEQVPETPESVN